jgi:hypothetical protein
MNLDARHSPVCFIEEELAVGVEAGAVAGCCAATLVEISATATSEGK